MRSIDGSLHTDQSAANNKNTAPKILHCQCADAPFPGVRHFHWQRLSSLGKAAGLWSQPIRLSAATELLTNSNFYTAPATVPARNFRLLLGQCNIFTVFYNCPAHINLQQLLCQKSRIINKCRKLLFDKNLQALHSFEKISQVIRVLHNKTRRVSFCPKCGIFPVFFCAATKG